MGSSWMLGAIASGIGIGIGGAIAWILKGLRINFIYALSAGIILGLLLFEMIPESIGLGGWWVFLLGATIGIAIFQYIHRSLDRITIITSSPQKDILVHTGILLTVSISIHNFPMGFVLGSNIKPELAGAMLLTLLLHNIPEGIIIFTPLFLSGFGILTWMIGTVMVTLPILVGSLLGKLIGIGYPYLLSFIISATISVIFMVATQELFKESVRHSSLRFSLIVGTAGLVSVYLFILAVS
ncbi:MULTISPECIES: ZIP family metal transporter [Pontibacillus]|uniref:ZIP family metal transporter n=1 Tax=Pontibacillus chungwhensis TaxID=265426 RepID=A0ABY8V3H9_9BACI|nr:MULTISPECIES: hypothetical protein [Pontibacillus]MCD5325955.1 hypothetical protein [Pontibacillus sp. HN14]WIF98411.1 hypothetical protein QNI29_01705 [Pontibacillus chungwhensis]